MRAFRATVLLLAVMLVACGGDGGGDTTSAQPTTTASGEGSTGTVSLEDMPQECIDALVGYLQAIEPALEDVDFDSAAPGDLEAIGTEVEDLGEEFSATIEELDCPEPGGTDEEAFLAMLDLAEREAPGTVAYLQWVQGFIEGTENAEASGDCETDMAALRVIIDEGGTMSELNMTQVVEVGTLVGSIATVCSPERAEEFFAEADVAAFLESQ